MNEIWGHIQKNLQKSLEPGLFKVWITPLTATVGEETLHLSAPNDFVANWVRDRLLTDIMQAASDVMGVSPHITVSAGEAKPPVTARKQGVALVKSASAAREESAVPVLASTSVPVASLPSRVTTQEQGVLPLQQGLASRQVDWRFDFDSFVVGPSNHLAFAASHGLCRDTFSTDTLFLSSAPGLGKTHLMQAVGNQLCKTSNRSNVRCEYLTAEEFATRLITALKTRDVERFKARYRGVDLLLLEDVHFLQGKERMQDEVLATIKSLQSSGSKVLLSSSFAPRDLKDVDSQLVSRFCSGFLAVIDKPDFDTRKDILRRKAGIYQVDLPENVTNLLAENIKADVRQIESCLHNLILKARIMNERISLGMAWEVISHYAAHEMVMDLEGIVRSVCEGFGLSTDQLHSRSRKREYVVARNTAFYLARKHTDLSLKEIGNRFNRRHSTVLKGITNIEREMSRETPIGRQVTSTVSMIERNGRIVCP